MDEALIQEQERQLQKTGRYYEHVFWLCVPLLCMACYFYGARPLLLCGIALLTGNLCDRLVALLRHRVYTNKDLSNESFSLIIALLMPATVDIYVLVVAVLAGVLIGKEVFGGYGSYPFNPAAVGYAVAAVSWPEQVFRYPQPYINIPLWDATGVPVSSTISDTLRSGGILNLNSLAIALGEFAAPMGTGAALVILACGLFGALRAIADGDVARGDVADHHGDEQGRNAAGAAVEEFFALGHEGVHAANAAAHVDAEAFRGDGADDAAVVHGLLRGGHGVLREQIHAPRIAAGDAKGLGHRRDIKGHGVIPHGVDGEGQHDAASRHHPTVKELSLCQH